MSCLCCQKSFETHVNSELQNCIEWIQDQHTIRSDKLRYVFERIEYLKKYGVNIYKGTITLHDIIRELEICTTVSRLGSGDET